MVFQIQPINHLKNELLLLFLHLMIIASPFLFSELLAVSAEFKLIIVVFFVPDAIRIAFLNRKIVSLEISEISRLVTIRFRRGFKTHKKTDDFSRIKLKLNEPIFLKRYRKPVISISGDELSFNISRSDGFSPEDYDAMVRELKRLTSPVKPV